MSFQTLIHTKRQTTSHAYALACCFENNDSLNTRVQATERLPKWIILGMPINMQRELARNRANITWERKHETWISQDKIATRWIFGWHSEDHKQNLPMVVTTTLTTQLRKKKTRGIEIGRESEQRFTLTQWLVPSCAYQATDHIKWNESLTSRHEYSCGR